MVFGSDGRHLVDDSDPNTSSLISFWRWDTSTVRSFSSVSRVEFLEAQVILSITFRLGHASLSVIPFSTSLSLTSVCRDPLKDLLLRKFGPTFLPP